MSAYYFEIKQREFSSSLFQKTKTSFCFRFTEALMKIQVRILLFSPICTADCLVIQMPQALFEVPLQQILQKSDMHCFSPPFPASFAIPAQQLYHQLWLLYSLPLWVMICMKHEAVCSSQASSVTPRLWKHRITEWLGLEGPLKIIQLQSPHHEQERLSVDQFTPTSIQPGLEHLQGWGIHNLSGQPVPVPHHPYGKEFIQLSGLNNTPSTKR